MHDDPLKAPVDGPTQWVSRFCTIIYTGKQTSSQLTSLLIFAMQPLRHLEELLEELIAIAVSFLRKPYSFKRITNIMNIRVNIKDTNSFPIMVF